MEYKKRLDSRMPLPLPLPHRKSDEKRFFEDENFCSLCHKVYSVSAATCVVSSTLLIMSEHEPQSQLILILIVLNTQFYCLGIIICRCFVFSARVYEQSSRRWHGPQLLQTLLSSASDRKQELVSSRSG
jgi:hypothetical protein